LLSLRPDTLAKSQPNQSDSTPGPGKQALPLIRLHDRLDWSDRKICNSSIGQFLWSRVEKKHPLLIDEFEQRHQHHSMQFFSEWEQLISFKDVE